MIPSPNRTGIAAGLIAAFFILPTSVAADNTATIRTIVDAAIRPLIAQYDVPGMAVAVTVDGRPVILNYGVASRENNTPVGDTTLFEIGSISKTLTGTLAAHAHGIGALSLDDHPGKYLPQLQGSAVDAASLLHLGTYTAGGLPLQFPDAITDQAQRITYFQRWKPDAAPGTQRKYSNPSIGLLGHITAIALKREFADAMHTEIFRPLGMTHSHLRVPEPAQGNYAWGYDKANKPIRINPGVFDTEAYGVKSTAADLIRFVQGNIEPKRLAAPLQRAVEGTQIGYFAVGEMVQGLGWEQYPYPISVERLLAGNSYAMLLEANVATRHATPPAPSGQILFNKTGSTNGFGAYVLFVPEKKIGIVMLANKNYPIPARIKAAYAILDQLAPVTR